MNFLTDQEYAPRTLETTFEETLSSGQSILLLGARQTGKTTLCNRLHYDRALSFASIATRVRYEKQPELLGGEIRLLAIELKKKPLIFLDEIQKVPQLMDEIQILIDEKIATFMITGSSSRKLKNYLPGRVISYQLWGLSLEEIFTVKKPLIASDLRGSSLLNHLPQYNFAFSASTLVWGDEMHGQDLTRKEMVADLCLHRLLFFGSLPGILLADNVRENRSDQQLTELLRTYVSTYLEEEIRQEALVRNMGAFHRFIELAAIESGNTIDFSKISQDVGVFRTTIADYYKILTDCYVAIRVDPFIPHQHPSRRRLIKAPKFLLFDMGIKRIYLQGGVDISETQKGDLFEQFIGLELHKLIVNHRRAASLHFWRDHNGPEVDWVIRQENNIIPIEVKWTKTPSQKDIRHLKLFMEENNVTQGYVVCRTMTRVSLSPNITAIPWYELGRVFEMLN